MYFTLPGLMFTIGIISAIGFAVWQLFFAKKPEKGGPGVGIVLLVAVIFGILPGIIGGYLVSLPLPKAVVVTINEKYGYKHFEDVYLLSNQIDGVKIQEKGAGYIFNLTDEQLRFESHFYSNDGRVPDMPKQEEIAPHTCKALTRAEFRDLRKHSPSSTIRGNGSGYYYFVY